jgi:hypothetical protein
MKPHVRRGCAAALLAVCFSVAGCSQIGPVTSDAEPAQVRPIAGTDLHRVVLTEEASRNLGILTEPVRQAALGRSAPSAAATTTFVPMTAVIYDPRGLPWVYTTPAPLTFVRTRIVIDRTTSEAAYLSSGPAVGTAVVTVGASELLGAEYGVGGE